MEIITSNAYIKQVIAQSQKTWHIKAYSFIIEHGLARQIAQPLSGYKERHHILPRSFKMGGDTDPANIVELTPREHFLCHLLLAKSFKGALKRSMCYAVFLLRGLHTRTKNTVRVNARTYESIKRAYSQSCKERVIPDITRANMSASHKRRWENGFSYSDETIDKLRKINVENNPMAIKVTINGITYPSTIAAMEALNISRYRVNRLMQGLSMEEAMQNKPRRPTTGKRGGNSTKKLPVEYEGVTYPSFTAFRKALGVSNTKGRKLLGR